MANVLQVNARGHAENDWLNAAATAGVLCDGPGKLADLVVLDADPLADVANLSHAERVIKVGVIYDPKALIDSIR